MRRLLSVCVLVAGFAATAEAQYPPVSVYCVSGSTWVPCSNPGTGTAPGGTAMTDDAAFTPATTSITPAGAVFDDVAPDSVNEGDGGAVRMSANRNLYSTIRDAAGNERGANVNASNQLSVSVDNTVTVASHAVTNAGTFAVQEDGAALTALQLIDNPVGSVSGGTAGTGSMAAGGVYSASKPTLTDGQQAAARLGVNGNFDVNLYAQNSSGTWTAVQAGADPCSGGAKSIHVINTSTATTVEIANAVSGQYFYICSINIVVAGAQTVAIVEDDTDGVGSPTAGLNGGTSAATGWSFAANGGISLGSGNGTVMRTSTANRYLGIITGSAVQTSGTITYVSAP